MDLFFTLDRILKTGDIEHSINSFGEKEYHIKDVKYFGSHSQIG